MELTPSVRPLIDHMNTVDLCPISEMHKIGRTIYFLLVKNYRNRVMIGRPRQVLAALARQPR